MLFCLFLLQVLAQHIHCRMVGIYITSSKLHVEPVYLIPNKSLIPIDSIQLERFRGYSSSNFRDF